MPTKRPSTTIVFESQDLLDHIDEFRYAQRFQNRSQALLFIVKAGMDALKDEYPELDMSTKLETEKKPIHDVITDRPKP